MAACLQSFLLGALFCACIFGWLCRGDNIASASVTDLIVSCLLELLVSVAIALYAVRRFEKKRDVFITAEHFVKHMEEDIEQACVQLAKITKSNNGLITGEILSTLLNLCDMAKALKDVLTEAGFTHGASHIAEKIVEDLTEYYTIGVIQQKRKITDSRQQESLKGALVAMKVQLMSLLARMHRY